MIFLTVGSELPFDRLTKSVDEWAKKNNRPDLLGQIADPGPHGYWPTHMQWQKFIPAEEYNRFFDEAEFIIGHAGMGSIITACLKRKHIIVMPRRADLKETRNDHQLATVEQLASRPGIHIAKNESVLGAILDDLAKSLSTQCIEATGEFAEERLIREIRSFILHS